MIRHGGIGLAAAVLSAVAGASQAQDYMGMVEQYGWNVQETLRTEIMNDAGRNAMRQSLGQRGQGRDASERSVWPSHISESSLSTHVFTVDEIAAMRNADPDRFRNMVDGQVITVHGTVRLPSRADSSFNLVGASYTGYRLWAYWRRGVTLPQAGAEIALRGRVEVERRSHLTMREGEFVNAVPATAPTAEPAAPDYDALRFIPSASVTRQVNAMLADGLESALRPGHSAEDLRNVLDSGRLQAAFRQLLTEQSFSDRDLADVLAGQLIILWQVAHDVPDLNQPQGYQVIRGGLREELASAGWPGLMNDQQKQTYAELIGTGSMLIVARYLDAKQSGDAPTVRDAALDAREMVRQQAGLDLLDYDLTAAGLVAQ